MNQKEEIGKLEKELEEKKMEITEIKRQIAFIGESVLETCKKQRGGFDFLEGLKYDFRTRTD